MLPSTNVVLSRLNLYYIFQSALFFCLTFLGHVESFSFTDKKPFDVVTIEINETVNYTISCQTDDPKAVTTLLYSNKVLPVGGRISLNNQNYIIHGLKLSDKGLYKCKATSSQGAGTIEKYLHLLLEEEKILCCPNVSPETKVMLIGSSADFVCYVNLQRFHAKEKYLSFKWYKKEGNTSVEVSDSETFRYNGSSSVLKIRNAQATPKGGDVYECIIIYRGKSSFFLGPRVVVHEITAPVISGVPITVTVDEFSKLTVDCKAEGYPVPNITWLRNGTLMSLCLETGDNNCDGKNYRVLIYKNEQWAYTESLLTIQSTKYPMDHGGYTCVAANNVQTVQKDMQVSVQTPPKLENRPNFWFQRKIYCKIFRSNPLPTFKWQFQIDVCLKVDHACEPSPTKWKDITPDFVVSPDVAMATEKSTLTIPQKVRSGFIRCIATNALGTNAHSAGFFAYENDDEIKMTAATMKFEYDEGVNLRLQCLMPWKGAMISWYKNGQRLTRASDARVNITWSVKSDRTWTSLGVERVAANDSGLYTCEAQRAGTGQYLNASNHITIHKVYPPEILSFDNETVYQETTVRLHCNITAHPAPTVKWFKDGQSIQDRVIEQPKLEPCKRFSEGFVYNVKGIIGLLVICYPSNARHTGFFTCQAINPEGNSNATAFLDVLEDPKIVSPNNDVTVHVKLGIPWNTTCIATGNPAPEVAWRRVKGNKSVGSRLRDGKGAVLKFAAVGQGDLGMYKCVAENSKKTATTIITLVSDGPLPDPSVTDGLRKEVVIGISVVGGAFFILFILGISFCVFIRHQRKQIKAYRGQFLTEFLGEHQIDPDRTLLEQCNNLPYDPDWEFPEDRLTLGDELGSGAFGLVIKAEAIGISDFNPRDKSVENVRRRSKMFRRSSSTKLYHDSKGMPYMKTTVAVKTLKANATQEEYRDLASELKILIHVGEHTNIINLLGACTKGKADRLLVILEYAPHGSLVKFLKGKRDIYEPTWAKTINNPEFEFTIAYLVAYAYQICRGMEFLASRKCVHRDLAARNVLVGEDYVIKVADFGLARDIYKSDVYVKSGGGVLPIKWMALESLFRKEYSEKSDVWSFGICLWEIFTLGGSPYPGIPTEQLLDILTEGYRMPKPENCPLEIYDIMMDCWQVEPQRRPTFAELSERIGRIIERQVSEQDSSSYICLMKDNTRNKSDYYAVPVESDPSNLRSGAAGYSRQSSEDLVHSPLPPLPQGTERQLERDERERTSEPEANGSLSENESGIDLEEAGDEITVGLELRPMARPNGKAGKKSKSKQTFV